MIPISREEGLLCLGLLILTGSWLWNRYALSLLAARVEADRDTLAHLREQMIKLVFELRNLPSHSDDKEMMEGQKPALRHQTKTLESFLALTLEMDLALQRTDGIGDVATKQEDEE